MNNPVPWIAVALASSALFVGVAGVMVLKRMRADSIPLSAEERAELSASPMTASQKYAWCGLLLGLVQIVVIVGLFLSQGGAEAYWTDDAMRLQIVGVFLCGLVLHSILMGIVSAQADERDLRVIRLAPQVQVLGLMFCLVGWHLYLSEKFHDAGAVPMVYNYLTFGSMFLILMLTWFIGVLLGYRLQRSHGQG